MAKFLEWLSASAQVLRSRYVRELESEVARLRADNRALVNSLLGTAGVPPLRIENSLAAATSGASRRGNNSDGSRKAAGTKDEAAAPAVRRRSWQQLGRMLEIEEARREREHAAQMAAMRGRVIPGAAEDKPSGKPNGRG